MDRNEAAKLVREILLNAHVHMRLREINEIMGKISIENKLARSRIGASLSEHAEAESARYAAKLAGMPLHTLRKLAQAYALGKSAFQKPNLGAEHLTMMDIAAFLPREPEGENNATV